jgi:NADH:ubiquinone oxidoreductase subunit E
MDTPTRKKRVVLCMGEFCNMDRRAAKLLERLQPLIDAHNDAHPDQLVKLETARCLSMCGAGPNCVVYPDDVVFNHLTPEKLETQIKALLTAEF